MASGQQARIASGRHAGLMVPLFSIPSNRSWGIGEIPDLAHLSRWMATAGLDFLMLLPVNEMQEGETSPYSALSAMALDPIFIALPDVPDFDEAGGEGALDARERSSLAAARVRASVDYQAVRRVKTRALRLAFASFHARHWSGASPRGADLRRFIERERWWLEDYAFFRALHVEQHGRSWPEWPEDLRDRQPAALGAARERLAGEILYFQYLQWLADVQWQRTRRECAGIGLFGDFPFMVNGHSADVWARPHEFRLDVSVGVPPDAFSETGQDWGLPAYRWDVVARNDYEWLRNRTTRCAELYDGFRVDHLVGFYRTYMKERDGRTYFVPEEEDEQRALGERLLKLFSSQGGRILAEDLGTVPDFVRASMAGLGVPGLKVFRWEREWLQPEKPFRDPARYPQISVATSGTHDTETMAEWWDNAEEDERRGVLEVPMMRVRGITAQTPFGDDVRDALIETLFAARSDLVVFPFQDVFGWRDRINRPASVGEQNWTWRLPLAVDELVTDPATRKRAAFLRRLAARHGRL